MSRDKLSWPHRTHLAGGVVADRDDEIEGRGADGRKFIPAFAAQGFDRHSELLEQIDREGIHFPIGKAAGAESAKLPVAPTT